MLKDRIEDSLTFDDVLYNIDGGVRFSRDLVKDFPAGAHTILVGSLFAGTADSLRKVVL
tara:strand:- start:628 stop:804 length:177 start_codon:yes stop_codon:yes gene_type:complete